MSRTRRRSFDWAASPRTDLRRRTPPPGPALNTLTFIFWIALNADISIRLDRSAGGLDTALLITGSLVLIGTAVVVWFRTRRTGPATTPPEPRGGRGDRLDPVSGTA
ncbi:hypothetical protein NGM33_17670 [Nocardiopsis dassonvillei]|uniref:hypothetical protein n=1 Tax=Nocardiopsis dassonvillei TaxID=2014 RepID=UPI0020A3EAF2|nr:hypothetical protein [Nocardiopsis dassonvillei]MCP3015160.1 hypothetical protein [Nocardiopsis dassonvillei]